MNKRPTVGIRHGVSSTSVGVVPQHRSILSDGMQTVTGRVVLGTGRRAQVIAAASKIDKKSK